LCGQRGLEPGTEQQCFIACLPNGFRERFDTLRRAASAGTVQQAEGIDAHTARMNTIIQVHESVNQYLTAFIDQRIENVSYAIKNRTFIEAVLDFEFEDFTGQGTLFR
jgi:hypothetical protein